MFPYCQKTHSGDLSLQADVTDWLEVLGGSRAAIGELVKHLQVAWSLCRVASEGCLVAVVEVA